MVKKGIFCLVYDRSYFRRCTLGGVSLKGKEKLAEPDFVLTYAENQAKIILRPRAQINLLNW